MHTLARKNIYLVYWVAVLGGIVSIVSGIEWLDFIFKPLLMPLLIAAILLLTRETKGRLKVLAALFFSFLGDVFLMLEFKSDIFFIAGLVCFLVTHLFYIAYFLGLVKPGPSLMRKYPFMAAVILLYTFLLLYFLAPYLGEMKVPVIVYACVIAIMLYFSLSLPLSLNFPVRRYLVSGAVLFVLSDTLLAINKYYSEFTGAAVLVRITYCIAQYFIARGFIKKRY